MPSLHHRCAASKLVTNLVWVLQASTLILICMCMTYNCRAAAKKLASCRQFAAVASIACCNRCDGEASLWLGNFHTEKARNLVQHVHWKAQLEPQHAMQALGAAAGFSMWLCGSTCSLQLLRTFRQEAFKMFSACTPYHILTSKLCVPVHDFLVDALDAISCVTRVPGGLERLVAQSQTEPGC